MTTAMSADSDVVDVVTAMLHADAHSMPIVDRIRLVGTLTRRDLVRALACNTKPLLRTCAVACKFMVEPIAGT